MPCPTIKEENYILDIPIPSNSEILVKKDQKVKEGELLFSAQDQGSLIELELSKLLNVSPDKTKDYLLCSLGSGIVKGQAIAEKKSLFGKTSIASPSDGVFEALTIEGVFRISKNGPRQDVRCPVNAIVQDVSGSNIKLAVAGEKITFDKGFGKSNWSGIEVLSDRELAGSSLLTHHLKDKIVIMRGLVSTGFFHKAEALEVAGIICGKISQDNFDSLPLLEMGDDGIITDEVWDKIKKLHDKKGFINGTEKYLFVSKN